MKAHTRSDGTRAITMTVQVAVDVPLLTELSLAAVLNQTDPEAVILAANKREIFALARFALETEGITVKNQVPNRVSKAVFQSCLEHVSACYPELE